MCLLKNLIFRSESGSNETLVFLWFPSIRTISKRNLVSPTICGIIKGYRFSCPNITKHVHVLHTLHKVAPQSKLP